MNILCINKKVDVKINLTNSNIKINFTKKYFQYWNLCNTVHYSS